MAVAQAAFFRPLPLLFEAARLFALTLLRALLFMIQALFGVRSADKSTEAQAS